MLRAPAAMWSFPAFVPRIFPQMLGPLPRRFLWCLYPFLPRGQRPSPCRDRLGTPHHPYRDFRTGDITGLQSFAHVQASGFARHPGRSYRRRSYAPRGSCGFYVRAYDGSLPPRPSDMLAVRIGQWTAWGLPPHKIRGLAGRSPGKNLCRICNGFHKLQPSARQFTMFFYDMRPSFVREPNRHTVFRVYSLCHAHSLTKDFPSLVLDRFAKSFAERYASAAAGSGSAADAGGSRLQAVVGRTMS